MGDSWSSSDEHTASSKDVTLQVAADGNLLLRTKLQRALDIYPWRGAWPLSSCQGHPGHTFCSGSHQAGVGRWGFGSCLCFWSHRKAFSIRHEFVTGNAGAGLVLALPGTAGKPAFGGATTRPGISAFGGTTTGAVLALATGLGLGLATGFGTGIAPPPKKTAPGFLSQDTMFYRRTLHWGFQVGLGDESTSLFS